jgi:hypothetical protein
MPSTVFGRVDMGNRLPGVILNGIHLNPFSIGGDESQSD